MIKIHILRGAVALLAAALTLICADPVLAQTSNLGEKVGSEVEALATGLFLGVAALVAIPVLSRRDVNGGLVVALLVLILGGFIFAPESVKSVIDDLWSSVA
ncbi:MAG TPA: hypothetical protein VN238_17770 [Solirubrobacteraceae bacterium]|nr:hypothetical protein [Solirubrobacteraceae bacterium]